MHTFNLIDSQILLGLAAAEKAAGKGAGISCAALITSCVEFNNTIPAAEEFAAAFNKFLYLSVIVIDGDQIALANLGRDIILKAKNTANVEASSTELMELVHKELSVYKLKSMCNRTVWTEVQYQQAIDAQRHNLKQ